MMCKLLIVLCCISIAFVSVRSDKFFENQITQTTYIYNDIRSTKLFKDAYVRDRYCSDKYGAHLVQIESKAEEDWIYDHIKPSGRFMLNIAQTAEHVRPTHWRDGANISYTNWATGEPNLQWSSNVFTVHNRKWYSTRNYVYFPMDILCENNVPTFVQLRNLSLQVRSEYWTISEELGKIEQRQQHISESVVHIAGQLNVFVQELKRQQAVAQLEARQQLAAINVSQLAN